MAFGKAGFPRFLGNDFVECFCLGTRQSKGFTLPSAKAMALSKVSILCRVPPGRYSAKYGYFAECISVWHSVKSPLSALWSAPYFILRSAPLLYFAECCNDFSTRQRLIHCHFFSPCVHCQVQNGLCRMFLAKQRNRVVSIADPRDSLSEMKTFFFLPRIVNHDK